MFTESQLNGVIAGRHPAALSVYRIIAAALHADGTAAAVRACAGSCDVDNVGATCAFRL